MKPIAAPRLLALLLALAAGAACAAGVVNVSFKDPEKFADIRDNDGRREDNLNMLAQHLQQLGQRLPDGQALEIEVLDVDLAGELRPFRRGMTDLRVLTGRADWPTLTLRYTLRQDGRVLKSGEERLADMSYLSRTPRAYGDGALRYEKRMLDEWFAERFARPD